MKYQVLLVCLALFVSTSAAQNRTTVELSPGYNATLQARVEQNASQVLTAFNTAFEDGTTPVLPTDIVTKQGRSAIEQLWRTTPFRCPETKVPTQLVRRTAIDGGYEIRGLPLVTKAAQEENNGEEGVLLFTPSGKIDGLYFGLEHHQYQAILCADCLKTEFFRRQVILDFIENFRTGYNRQDLSLISNVFSENALIIVGRVIQREDRPNDILERSALSQEQVEYVRRNKKQYIEQLRRVFSTNAYIKVGFDEIEVFQHPKHPEIYGVTLLQNWASSTYNDQGYLFLMIDFKDETRPIIHVRTWQPGEFVTREEVFQLGDFEIIN